MTHYLKHLFLAGCLMVHTVGGSLGAKTHTLYTTTEGLPSSRITNLTFDAQDFLWISSEMGLTRFDGEDFVTYQGQKDTPNHLRMNNVNVLYTDRDGSHWVGTSDGMYYFCRAYNKFTHYDVRPDRSDVSVSSIVDHPLCDHTLIVGSYGWGIHIFDTQKREFDAERGEALAALLNPGSAPFLHIDSHQRLWAMQDSWLSVIDLKEMKALSLLCQIPEEMRNNLHFKGVAEDKQRDRLYLTAGIAGIFEVDLMHLTIKKLPLHVEAVNDLAMSPEGTLVIGTEGKGLWNYNPNTFSLNRLTAPGIVDLNHAKVQHIAFDSRGNLWLGIFQRGVMMMPSLQQSFYWQTISETNDDPRNLACVADFASLPNGDRAYALDGAGVMILHPDQSRTLYGTSNQTMVSDAALALHVLPDASLLVSLYREGLYCIGTDGKARRLPELQPMIDKSVVDFAYDKQEQILYMGTNGNGLFSYNLKTKEVAQVEDPDNNSLQWVGAIYLNSKRHLWVGTANRPRYLDLNTGVWQTPSIPTTVMPITGYAEDTKGEMWLSTHSGLVHYDADQNAMVQITENDQLRQRSYNALLKSDEDRLWLATPNEITIYDVKEQRFAHYFDAAITTLGTPSPRSAIIWPDGTYSFGGDNGVLNFRPNAVLDSKKTLPSLCLKRLWVDNVPTDYDPDRGTTNVLDSSLWCANRLTLPAGHESFSVSYALLDYAGTPGVHYSHRLKGYEDEWHEGYAMTATYPSLPAGRYTLQIRAKQPGINGEDNVSERELIVDVQPHWYATWWARILWLLLLFAIGYIIYRQVKLRKSAHKAMLEAERERERKEEKFDLLISVSHEIKTPLTLIISPLRKLLHRKTDPATHSVIEAIYRNSLRILMLVNEQMDVRKLDQGQLHLHVSEFGLRSFLDDMMQYFRNAALSRHLDYTLTMPPSRDNMTVWADPAQLDKVFLNLLSNATKYVPDNGRVEIKVSDCPMPDGGQGIRISVFNSGSQLPEEEQPKAFESIGLKLALELVKLHHGSLTVSNQDDGVAFNVDLPVGNGHYTAAELAVVKAPVLTSQTYDDEEEPLNDKGSIADMGDYASTSRTAKEDREDRELVEQLNDELRETQRMRERRANLSYNYQEIQMSGGDEKLLHRVVEVIHKNMSDTEFSVETLSQEVGISRVHLNRKLKELIDTSPSSLIKSVRLKQAAFLLAQSNVTVAEVAYTVGFSSPAYFSSNFSQYFGMTPKEFTNAYTENPDSEEIKELLQ